MIHTLNVVLHMCRAFAGFLIKSQAINTGATQHTGKLSGGVMRAHV